MHEDKRKLCRDVAPDSSEQQLDPDRVGDHEPEQVLVILIRQQGGARQARVVTLQLPVQSNLAQCQRSNNSTLIYSLPTPVLMSPLAPGASSTSLCMVDPGPMGQPSAVSSWVTLAVAWPPVNIAMSMCWTTLI